MDMPRKNRNPNHAQMFGNAGKDISKAMVRTIDPIMMSLGPNRRTNRKIMGAEVKTPRKVAALLRPIIELEYPWLSKINDSRG
jgi:hypothetical protein